MAVNTSQLIDAAQVGFAAQQNELSEIRARQPMSVTSKTSTGTANINVAFNLDRVFRLVYVRCHFSGSPGVDQLTLSLDSANGATYDTDLYSITSAGTGSDVNFRISAQESAEPSAWTFQSGDALRVQWTNPDSGNITWGLEVGLAIAS